MLNEWTLKSCNDFYTCTPPFDQKPLQTTTEECQQNLSFAKFIFVPQKGVFFRLSKNCHANEGVITLEMYLSPIPHFENR